MARKDKRHKDFRKREKNKKIGPGTIAVGFDAARSGDLKRLRSSLEHYDPPTLWSRYKNASGETLLHAAAGQGHYQAVEFLLGSHAEVNAQDGSGDTALHKAAAFGISEVGQLLLDAGANVCAQNRMGESPCHRACRFAHVGFLKMLCSRGADPKALTSNGWTALHVAATNAEESSREMTLRLLALGVDWRTVDIDGWTALHVSASEGNVGTTEVLLDLMGRDPVDYVNMGNAAGETPLYIACEHQHCNVIRRLLDDGAEFIVAENGATPMHAAVRSRRVKMETLELLLKATPPSLIHARLENGKTPFMCLVSNSVSTPDMIRLFMDAGCCAAELDNAGRSAFHYAVKRGSLEIAHTLMEKGVRDWGACFCSGPDIMDMVETIGGSFANTIREIVWSEEDQIDAMRSEVEGEKSPERVLPMAPVGGPEGFVEGPVKGRGEELVSKVVVRTEVGEDLPSPIQESPKSSAEPSPSDEDITMELEGQTEDFDDIKEVDVKSFAAAFLPELAAAECEMALCMENEGNGVGDASVPAITSPQPSASAHPRESAPARPRYTGPPPSRPPPARPARATCAPTERVPERHVSVNDRAEPESSPTTVPEVGKRITTLDVMPSAQNEVERSPSFHDRMPSSSMFADYVEDGEDWSDSFDIPTAPQAVLGSGTSRSVRKGEDEVPYDSSSVSSMCFHGETSSVRSLITALGLAAKRQSLVPDASERTPLHYAASSENISADLIGLLTSLDGLDCNARDYRGRTAFLIAAENVHSTPEILEIFIDNGSRISEGDVENCTPLHAVCARGELDLVRLLLERFPLEWGLCFAESPTPLDVADPSVAVELGDMIVALEDEDEEGAGSSDEDLEGRLSSLESDAFQVADPASRSQLFMGTAEVGDVMLLESFSCVSMSSVTESEKSVDSQAQEIPQPRARGRGSDSSTFSTTSVDKSFENPLQPIDEEWLNGVVPGKSIEKVRKWVNDLNEEEICQVGDLQELSVETMRTLGLPALVASVLYNRSHAK